jgi:hypothetical protein
MEKQILKYIILATQAQKRVLIPNKIIRVPKIVIISEEAFCYFQASLKRRVARRKELSLQTNAHHSSTSSNLKKILQ